MYTQVLSKISNSNIDIAWWKASSLWEMMQVWIWVPEGFIILTHAFERHIENLDFVSYDSILKWKIDVEIEQEILQEYKKLNIQKVAVRSSATAEDSKWESWAWQLDTYLNTDTENLLQNIKKCWASLYSPRAIAYRKENNLDTKKISVAVVIQAMIQSEKSWVIFSVNPISQNKDELVIEAGIGLWEDLVSGNITPDNYVLNRNTYNIIHSSIQNRTPILTKSEIKKLATQAKDIETHYWFPCDIEWAIEKNKIWILQSRPITTLENKETKNLSKLFKKQISLSEWFDDINHDETHNFRNEDNWKRQRMQDLSLYIPFPSDVPTSFDALDISNKSEEYKDFLINRWDELCALRLIPKEEWFPKLRMRWLSVSEVVNTWLPKQNIDYNKYQADFVPHSETSLWSTIFIVNKYGISGEIIRGWHHQISQGFYDIGNTPIQFSFNFKELKTHPKNTEAEAHLKEILNYIHTPKQNIQEKVSGEFEVSFFNDYLSGYFETVTSSEFWLWFIDWNRVLWNIYKDFWSPVLSNITRPNTITWSIWCPWVIKWTIKIVDVNNISSTDFKTGDILLCRVTSPDYIPLMKKAWAIITQQWWILSHAAIVSREMNIPCIVWIAGIMNILKQWDTVIVNADIGTIELI